MSTDLKIARMLFVLERMYEYGENTILYDGELVKSSVSTWKKIFKQGAKDWKNDYVNSRVPLFKQLHGEI